MKNYNFKPLGKPLKFPITDNGKIVLPAGTTGVDIAFGESSKTYKKFDKKTQTSKICNQNVYRHNGVIYNV